MIKNTYELIMDAQGNIADNLFYLGAIEQGDNFVNVISAKLDDRFTPANEYAIFFHGRRIDKKSSYISMTYNNLDKTWLAEIPNWFTALHGDLYANIEVRKLRETIENGAEPGEDLYSQTFYQLVSKDFYWSVKQSAVSGSKAPTDPDRMIELEYAVQQLQAAVDGVLEKIDFDIGHYTDIDALLLNINLNLNEYKDRILKGTITRFNHPFLFFTTDYSTLKAGTLIYNGMIFQTNVDELSYKELYATTESLGNVIEELDKRVINLGHIEDLSELNNIRELGIYGFDHSFKALNSGINQTTGGSLLFVYLPYANYLAQMIIVAQSDEWSEYTKGRMAVKTRILYPPDTWSEWETHTIAFESDVKDVIAKLENHNISPMAHQDIRDLIAIKTNETHTDIRLRYTFIKMTWSDGVFVRRLFTNMPKTLRRDLQFEEETDPTGTYLEIRSENPLSEHEINLVKAGRFRIVAFYPYTRSGLGQTQRKQDSKRRFARTLSLTAKGGTEAKYHENLKTQLKNLMISITINDIDTNGRINKLVDWYEFITNNVYAKNAAGAVLPISEYMSRHEIGESPARTFNTPRTTYLFKTKNVYANNKIRHSLELYANLYAAGGDPLYISQYGVLPQNLPAYGHQYLAGNTQATVWSKGSFQGEEWRFAFGLSKELFRIEEGDVTYSIELASRMFLARHKTFTGQMRRYYGSSNADEFHFESNYFGTSEKTAMRNKYNAQLHCSLVPCILSDDYENAGRIFERQYAHGRSIHTKLIPRMAQNEDLPSNSIVIRTMLGRE